MTSRQHRLGRSRSGKFLIMGALLLPAMLGAVALSVDYGVHATAQAQLRTAADGAALAGAMKLADSSRLAYVSNLTTQIASAQSRATAVATANRALGRAPVVIDNPMNSASGDVVVGYVDPTHPGSGLTTTASPTLYNAVQVSLGRDATHDGTIPMIFGRALGRTSSTTHVRATALAAHYSVKGFQSSPNLNANLLPVALDATTYNSMIASNGRMAITTTDAYSYNPNTGAIASTPDGVYESRLYPIGTGSPGNWGTVKIGVSNNSTSVLSDQILYGITPAQLATYPGGVLQLNPQTGTLILSGNPGLSAGLSSAFSSSLGRPVFVPIYTSVQGNGNNTTYTISGFGGVRLMAVNFQGSPKYVVVQPATVTDPTALTGSAQVGWTSGGLLRIGLTE